MFKKIYSSTLFFVTVISAFVLCCSPANADVLRVFSNGCESHMIDRPATDIWGVSHSRGLFTCYYIAAPQGTSSAANVDSIWVDFSSAASGAIFFHVCRQSWNLAVAPVCSDTNVEDLQDIRVGANNLQLRSDFLYVQGLSSDVTPWDYYYITGEWHLTGSGDNVPVQVFGWATEYVQY